MQGTADAIIAAANSSGLFGRVEDHIYDDNETYPAFVIEGEDVDLNATTSNSLIYNSEPEVELVIVAAQSDTTKTQLREIVKDYVKALCSSDAAFRATRAQIFSSMDSLTSVYTARLTVTHSVAWDVRT